MNIIAYCRQVGRLLADYDREAGFDKDKHLVSEEYVDILLANGDLSKLLGVGDAEDQELITPQQVVDFISEVIRPEEQPGEEFSITEWPRYNKRLLSNPGLADLIRDADWLDTL